MKNKELINEIQNLKESIDQLASKPKNETSEKKEDTQSPVIRLSPVLATIIVAIIGLVGTGVGALIQGKSELELEKQKLKSQLLLKALDTRNREDAAQFLSFLKKTKLVDDIDDAIDEIVMSKESLPLRPESAILMKQKYAEVENSERGKRIISGWLENQNAVLAVVFSISRPSTTLDALTLRGTFEPAGFKRVVIWVKADIESQKVVELEANFANLNGGAVVFYAITGELAGGYAVNDIKDPIEAEMGFIRASTL